MIGSLLWLEIVSWFRDRLLLTLLCTIFSVLIGISSWAVHSDLKQQSAQVTASNAARAQWEGQGAANPHNMAHFGDFVFRPSGPLTRLDHGVQARLGKVLLLEGHRQNSPLHADVTRAGSIGRFVRLDSAFLLQTIVPLLMIFLGSTGLAADRQSGRLKLILAQGCGAGKLMVGHFLALWVLALILLATVVITSLLSSALWSSEPFDESGRLFAFVSVHALFFAVVAAGISSATIWLRSATAALFSLLLIWVMASIVLPRATSSLAAMLHPLPSQDAFQSTLRAARESGPDAHNSQDLELDKLRQATLQQYAVDRVEDLPLNFDGIAMQVDEEFGNRVWDKHYGALRATLTQQLAFANAVALINPFQAIQQVSMTLAGTDLGHDLAFQHQAEQYRRDLVQQLNDKHAYGGSKTGDWSWQAEAMYYRSLEPFHHDYPSLNEALRSRTSAVIGLLLWAAILLGALLVGGRRLQNGRLPC